MRVYTAFAGSFIAGVILLFITNGPIADPSTQRSEVEIKTNKEEAEVTVKSNSAGIILVSLGMAGFIIFAIKIPVRYVSYRARSTHDDGSTNYLYSMHVESLFQKQLSNVEKIPWIVWWLVKKRAPLEILDAKDVAAEQIGKIDKKIDRLTVAYLDQEAFSAAEFHQKKKDELGKRRALLDSLAALDMKENQRFEPVIRFLNGSKQMKYVAQRGDRGELREKLEEIGSNLTVRDRRLQFDPRGAWQLVAGQRSFAQHHVAPDISGATFLGETRESLAQWSLLTSIRRFFEDNPSWK
jgi:hypothetical protein